MPPRPSIPSAIGRGWREKSRTIRRSHTPGSSSCAHATNSASSAAAAGSRGNRSRAKPQLQISSFHNSGYLPRIPKCQFSNNATVFNRKLTNRSNLPPYKSSSNLDNYIHKRLLSTPPPYKPSISHSRNNSTQVAATTKRKRNTNTRYFTTKTANDIPPPSRADGVETELSQLRSEIARLSYLVKQASSQQVEAHTLSRRAEARAYIIENKLMDIQRHVVKIPAVLERLPGDLRRYVRDRSPKYVGEALRRAQESGAASFLTSKYAAWLALGVAFASWKSRPTVYRQTSEEIASVASMTLRQDSLRETIQETLTAVAASPETLVSLSALFRRLIREERTERQLVDLIVRALNSEGVRDAAILLLDASFRNENLQIRAGEFLKVAAHATVLDGGVQKSAGVGMQQALKSAVVPWWAKNTSVQHANKTVDGPTVVVDGSVAKNGQQQEEGLG